MFEERSRRRRLRRVEAYYCTVSVVWSVTGFCCPGWVKLAEIVVVPAAAPLANPAAVIGATLAADEFHVTCVVRSTVLPSLKVPVALNC